MYCLIVKWLEIMATSVITILELHMQYVDLKYRLHK